MNDNAILNSEKLETLTPETVRKLWSKTYNTDGKPDWSHIFPYYADNIIFQDSIQRVEGKEDFLGVCNRLTERCQELQMELLTVAQSENVIIFDWVMTMVFKKFPSTPMYGSSKLTLDENGMIKEQRDYYDLWGDIFNNIPRFNKMYRRFMKRKFG